MIATMKDIAERCGLSIATVSRVLSPSGKPVPISDKTRQRVLQAAEELGYRRNRLAAALVTGRTQSIGVVSEIPVDSFSSRLIAGIQTICDRNDHSLVFGHANHLTTDILSSVELLLERCTDAIIIASKFPLADLDYAVERLGALDTPVILTDQSLDDPRFSYVVTDDRVGVRRLVDYLIGLGHRRIAFVSDIEAYTVNERLAGYRTSLALAELPWDGELVPKGNFTEASGAECIDGLLALPDPPTAVVAASDVVAAGILRRLRELDVRVPDHISVAGFADLLWTDMLGLTTVRQPAFEIGVTAAELALRLAQEPNLMNRKIALPVELIIRQTTAPPPARAVSGRGKGV